MRASSLGRKVSSALAQPSAAARVSGARLLLVDDDAVFLRLLAENLQADGFATVAAGGAEEALAVLRREAAGFDLCLFDWDMPGLDGLGLLRRLEAEGIAARVVFLTGHASPLFEEAALAAGAVDFIDKSRGPAIVRRRLALALSRGVAPPDGDSERGDGEEVRVGDLLLRGGSHRAVWRGSDVPLSRGEFEMVHLLARRAGDDVPYRALYDALRGEGFAAGQGEEGYRANVRAMVKRIRRKFESIDPEFDSLGTYAGFGYRWRLGP